MLGLYPGISSVTNGTVLSLLNELSLQKEKQNSSQMMCFGHKSSKVNIQQQQNKRQIPCKSRESNPGPLAMQSDALALDHRDN